MIAKPQVEIRRAGMRTLIFSGLILAGLSACAVAPEDHAAEVHQDHAHVHGDHVDDHGPITVESNS